MSIGISTNQHPDLSSLNSGPDINTSNQPSADVADAFAKAVGGQSSSDSGDVIVPRDFSAPVLSGPLSSEPEVGSFWSASFNYIKDGIEDAVCPGMAFSQLSDAVRQGKMNTLSNDMQNALQHWSGWQKLSPQSQGDIMNMLKSISTGDFSPNTYIQDGLDLAIDQSDLSSGAKSDLKTMVHVFMDAVSAAEFVAGLPESCLAIFSEDGVKACLSADDLAHTAVGWYDDLKAAL